MSDAKWHWAGVEYTVVRLHAEDWAEPTLEQEFAGRMDEADRVTRAEHEAAERSERANRAECGECRGSRKCPECRGSRFDDITGRRCWWCAGEGTCDCTIGRAITQAAIEAAERGPST